jgi:hypothetical protein
LNSGNEGTILVASFMSSASAQTIAGTVRDGTGAVLPGVTVEASSPALSDDTVQGETRLQ